MAALILLLVVSLLVSLAILVFLNPKTVKQLTPSVPTAVVLLPFIAGLGLCVAGTMMESHKRPWIDSVKGIGLVPSGSDFLVYNATHRFSINSESLVSTLQEFALGKTDVGVEFGSQKLVQMLQLNSLSPSSGLSESVSWRLSDGPTVLAGGVALCAIGAGLCAKLC